MNRKIKKEVRQLIKKSQAEGQTNKEIYNKLTEEYEDEETLVRFIVTMLKPKDKKKHRLYNGILLGLTAIVVLFNIWIIWTTPEPFVSCSLRSTMIAIIITLCSYIAVLNAIYQKPTTSYIFWICSISYLIFGFLFLELLQIWDFKWLLYTAINILSLVSIILLARFFQRKIFPDYRYRQGHSV